MDQQYKPERTHQEGEPRQQRQRETQTWFFYPYDDKGKYKAGEDEQRYLLRPRCDKIADGSVGSSVIIIYRVSYGEGVQEHREIIEAYIRGQAQRSILP